MTAEGIEVKIPPGEGEQTYGWFDFDERVVWSAPNAIIGEEDAALMLAGVFVHECLHAAEPRAAERKVEWAELEIMAWVML